MTFRSTNRIRLNRTVAMDLVFFPSFTEASPEGKLPSNVFHNQGYSFVRIVPEETQRVEEASSQQQPTRVLLPTSQEVAAMMYEVADRNVVSEAIENQNECLLVCLTTAWETVQQSDLVPRLQQYFPSMECLQVCYKFSLTWFGLF